MKNTFAVKRWEASDTMENGLHVLLESVVWLCREKWHWDYISIMGHIYVHSVFSNVITTGENSLLCAQNGSLVINGAFVRR